MPTDRGVRIRGYSIKHKCINMTQCACVYTHVQKHTHTHTPGYGTVEEAWQHKVLPVYEEVLHQHPQGEEQVDSSKDIQDNLEPILKAWLNCPYCFLKGYVHTVRERREEWRVEEQ